MAAWTARIDAILDAGDLEHLQVNVSYFDATDTQFANELCLHTFSFEFGTAAADMRRSIVALGQQQRQVAATIVSAQSLVGTTVVVP